MRMRLISLMLLFSLGGSSYHFAVKPITAHRIIIRAERLEKPLISTSTLLRYVDGWSITSEDESFGGLSSLMLDKNHFTAISDIGAIVRFTVNQRGVFENASISPLPKGCARDQDKTGRDSESITHDPRTGQIWIGLEWRNAICRSDDGLKTAAHVVAPQPMRVWPKTGGPETMIRLNDGRFMIFAERARSDGAIPPILVYDRDPTLAKAHFQIIDYKAAETGFAPTDGAMLPGGCLLILNRGFSLPYAFSASLSLVEPIGASLPKILSGQTIARFGRPGLTSNFEGIAISNEGNHIFVWLISDNNFMWIEHTYLLKFEILPAPKS